MAEISNLKKSPFSATRQRRSGTESYYHMNHLGSVTHITDKQGDVVEQYSYDVYGYATILNADFEQLDASSIGNIYYFTGRQLDFETGIYYYRARYYDAVVGRFLQRDPVADDILLNLYAYVQSTPTMYQDPSGLSSPIPEDGSFSMKKKEPRTEYYQHEGGHKKFKYEWSFLRIKNTVIITRYLGINQSRLSAKKIGEAVIKRTTRKKKIRILLGNNKNNKKELEGFKAYFESATDNFKILFDDDAKRGDIKAAFKDDDTIGIIISSHGEIDKSPDKNNVLYTHVYPSTGKKISSREVNQWVQGRKMLYFAVFWSCEGGGIDERSAEWRPEYNQKKPHQYTFNLALLGKAQYVMTYMNTATSNFWFFKTNFDVNMRQSKRIPNAIFSANR